MHAAWVEAFSDLLAAGICYTYYLQCLIRMPLLMAVLVYRLLYIKIYAGNESYLYKQLCTYWLSMSQPHHQVNLSTEDE